MISLIKLHGTPLISLVVFATILAYSDGSYAAGSYPEPDTQAVAQVLAGECKTAYASWWGYDPNDATASLQAAIDSGAEKVIVEDMKNPWIVRPIKLASNQELVLAKGVVLLAKRGEFKDANACLLSASGKRNIRVTGPGATLRMWRDDYNGAPYEKAEWRHAISIRSCTNVNITGLTIVESGGDGIYLGVSRDGVTNTNVEIHDVICDRNYRQGISVISAKNLLIENTVLRDTAGTPPMAGIDFEPNHSSEVLVNCVMKNCLVEGNSGDGFLLALHNLTNQSQPISIRVESCRSVGNRNGFRLNTGNGGPRTCVPGSIEVVDCRLEGSEQAGILVSNKTPDGCALLFRTCRIVAPAREQPGLSPIMFATSSGSSLNVGGVEFDDVVISDSRDRLPIGYNDRAGGLKLVQLGGTLTVERQGQKTVYPLDQKTLDEWFPFQSFKQFPHFNMADLNWQWALPEAQPQLGWNCAVRQRDHSEFMFRADAGMEITFTLELKRVGKSTTPEASVIVMSPLGERKSLPKMTGEGKQQYTFKATQAGTHRIVCEPGRSTVQVVASNLPISLYSERAPFHLLGSTGDAYFCVPAGVEEFGVRLTGGGERENVKATVYDAAGRKVGEKDNIKGHQFLLYRAQPTETEVWRLQLSKPSQGVIEDYYVQLQGIPPVLATRPDALPKPANKKSHESGSLPRLKISENARFLVTEDGKPFFWLGDTAWAVIQKYTREQSDNQPSVFKYFKSRASKRFNVIQCRLAGDVNTTNAYGHEAFVGNRFDRPRIVKGRNNDYWDTADWFITQAKEHGLYLALLPTWFNSVPNDDPMIKNPAVAYRYGHFIGTRYRDEPHIVWVLGGDPDRRNDRDVDHPPRLAATRALTEGIADGQNGTNRFDGKADYSTTLMTYHPRGGGQSSSRLLHNEDWLDFNMIQTTSHFIFTNYRTVGADYAKRPIKPTLEAEVAYEYSVDLSRRKELDKRIQPWHVRKAAYWSIFAGGFGFTYGHRSYILWVRGGESLKYGADIPWFESLDAPGAFDMTHLRDLMESRPFLSRVPDQSIVADGPAGKLDYVVATRSTDGSYAMLYFPTGKPSTVQMAKISADKVRAWWFDPREGKAEEIGMFASSGKKLFSPPFSGQDNDWILVLDDPTRNFPPPGTREKSVMAGQGPPYFPPPDSEGGWRTLTDSEEIRRVTGVDVRKLDAAFEVAEASTKNGGLLVVRHGWLIYERYFGRGHREATPNLASCGKSFTSIAIGILMHEHPDLFPDGLDQKVFTPTYLPPEAFPLSDPAMADIKLGQLLAFSAGIRGNNPGYINGKETKLDPPGPDGWPALVDEIALGKRDHFSRGRRYSAATLWCKPGGGYSYATASIHIASMIVRHVAGVELQEYLQKHLAEEMGWGRWGYGYKYAKQVTHTPGGGGITLRATDMLRFGYLLLHEGRWGEKQLVPAEYVRHSSRQSPYNPHYPYSLQFNVNTDGHYPDYPRDAFWKSGSGAHMLYVVPSLDLVVWKLAGRDGQYTQRDTGVPLDPEIAKGSESRRGWKPTINDREGQRLLLHKVIDAIVAP